MRISSSIGVAYALTESVRTAGPSEASAHLDPAQAKVQSGGSETLGLLPAGINRHRQANRAKTSAAPLRGSPSVATASTDDALTSGTASTGLAATKALDDNAWPSGTIKWSSSDPTRGVKKDEVNRYIIVERCTDGEIKDMRAVRYFTDGRPEIAGIPEIQKDWMKARQTFLPEQRPARQELSSKPTFARFKAPLSIDGMQVVGVQTKADGGHLIAHDKKTNTFFALPDIYELHKNKLEVDPLKGIHTESGVHTAVTFLPLNLMDSVNWSPKQSDIGHIVLSNGYHYVLRDEQGSVMLGRRFDPKEVDAQQLFSGMKTEAVFKLDGPPAQFDNALQVGKTDGGRDVVKTSDGEYVVGTFKQDPTGVKLHATDFAGNETGAWFKQAQRNEGDWVRVVPSYRVQLQQAYKNISTTEKKGLDYLSPWHYQRVTLRPHENGVSLILKGEKKATEDRTHYVNLGDKERMLAYAQTKLEEFMEKQHLPTPAGLTDTQWNDMREQFNVVAFDIRYSALKEIRQEAIPGQFSKLVVPFSQDPLVRRPNHSADPGKDQYGIAGADFSRIRDAVVGDAETITFSKAEIEAAAKSDEGFMGALESKFQEQPFNLLAKRTSA